MEQVATYTNDAVALQAINDETAFSQFKRNRQFTEILEHVSYSQGVGYLNRISELTSNELPWSKCIENDIIGNPVLHDFAAQLKSTVELNTYNISPTTIRYVAFGLQILNYIQSKNKTKLSIVEVGGGYGGQCKILFDICDCFGIEIDNYTIIDLDNVSKLQRKYLDKLCVQNVTTLPYTNCLSDLDDHYDLFISNYALGEFTTETQNFYIQNVLNKCDNYFITWNTFPINPNLKDYSSSEEVPQTGHKQFPNVILTN
jgi:putative sugar O-methyltransferase|uniref:Sugar O-methyltransferase n=1 Tax=viral metagenome TaxID=1070528 RepID=A0A6C0IRV2_9ZZZZ